ncbi:MAG TPA: DUF1206 domain-containing protein [Thermoanaerobaculia bacterium]|jgi:hypothetical protein|nr:DUF1206 domain-containing protein [Thermoanaerobaculia bacterium]
MARPTTNTLSQAGRQIESTARAALRNPWVEPLARFGIASRGAVYALIGMLALQTAVGARGRQETDTRTALQWVAEQSTALLWLLALGLFGYALWRVVQGVLDPENKGSDPKGLAVRAGRVISGLIYGGLALAAVRIASGSGDASGGGAGGGTQGFTADLMTKPFGRWIVAIAGICVIGSGLFQIWQGWTEKFREKLKLQEMHPNEQKLALRTGKVGLIARGVVFLMSGWFLIQAALRFDPSEAQGLGGALEALARQPAGAWLLGLVALGLIAFGAYSILLARYRRIVF